MMKESLKNIFAPSLHLTEKELDLYSQNKLSGEELYRIEKHLIDCPLCSDAVDGAFLLTHNKGNKSIILKISVKTKKERLYWRAVAAVLILAISCGGLFWWQKSTDKSKIAIVNDKISNTNRLTSPPLLEQEIANIDKKSLRKEKINPTKSSDLQLKDIIYSSKNPVTEIVYDESNGIAHGKNLSTENDTSPVQFSTIHSGVATEDTKIISKQKAENVNSVADMNYLEEISNDREQQSRKVNNVAQKASEIEMSFPEQATEAVLATSAGSLVSNKEILLNEGVELYKNNQIQEAIRKFVNAAKHPKTQSIARYYLAQCYIKLSRWSKAKIILQEIINGDMVDKSAAVKTLDSLKLIEK